MTGSHRKIKGEKGRQENGKKCNSVNDGERTT